MNILYELATTMIDRGLMPDCATRMGIRRLLRKRLKSSVQSAPRDTCMAAFLDQMDNFDGIAPVPEKANEQHYEVPASFYNACLGIQKKYSSCFYPTLEESLDEAEEGEESWRQEAFEAVRLHALLHGREGLARQAAGIL